MAMTATVLFMMALIPSVAPAFCTGGKLEKADIDSKVLEPINSKRENVLKGNVAGLPKGKKMNKLEWDCSLELEAIGSVDGSCVTKQPTDKAWITGFRDITETLTDQISEWLFYLDTNDVEKAKAVGSNAVSSIIGDLEEPFNLIRASTTKIGCVETTCNDESEDFTAVYCLTDQKKLEVNDVVYEVGSGTCSDAECGTGRSCNTGTGLCEESTATTSFTSFTTNGATTAASYPGELPSGTSTLCKDNSGMTDDLRTRFLDTQNYRRSILVQGQVQRPSGKNLPKGGDMLKLVLDCDLEKAAIEEVRTCPSTKTASTYGKNFDKFASSSVVATYADAVKKAVTNWWKVVRHDNTGPGMLVTFRSKHVGTAIETYTQIAWSRTNYLGCAIAKCSSSYTVICLYKPKGNIPDEVLYKIGNPCSACPSGTCDSGLGLCM
ncbi:unnamed protein product [Cylicocyclus nassatus]|uniref:SCP domain-containing protein n=1 Tax=Cylicocyclus nassatus TaxID=53992 RepID=A0AA36HB61_CYLNA|nr:unnamed protein product [Cylicocyclus nassatus]